MKKLILLAGVAALASCGEPAASNDAAPADNDMAMEGMAEEEAATAPDGGPIAGTYALRDMEGTETGRVTIAEDMSYTFSSVDGEETEAGMMSMNEEGKVCFDPEGPKEAACYPGGGAVNEDGSWVDYDEDGNETGTIIRV